MEWFYYPTYRKGWTTTSVLRIMPEIEPVEKYIPKTRIEYVRESCADLKATTWRPYDNIKDYNKILKEIEPADIHIVLSTHTYCSKPPLNVPTELAAVHPSNLLVQQVSKRASQFNKSCMIDVIDPPYIAVVDPKTWPRCRITKPLEEFYMSHAFVAWDNIERQERIFNNKLERAEFEPYAARGYKPPKWNKETEKLRLWALESILTENIVSHITEKCNQAFYMLIPNSTDTKKRIKSNLISAIKEKRPDIDTSTADIVADVWKKETYKEKGVCSPAALNKLAVIVESEFGARYTELEKKKTWPSNINVENYARACPHGRVQCEWAPRSDKCELLNNSQQCIHPIITSVLEKYTPERRKEILDFMDKVKIRIPTLQTILKDLNRDLYAELKPLEMPPQTFDRKDLDGRGSNIASSWSALEFFLRDKGLLEVAPEIMLRADVGNVCHKTIELTAPYAWRNAVESARFVVYEPKSEPLKGQKIKIGFTPDVLGMCTELRITSAIKRELSERADEFKRFDEVTPIYDFSKVDRILYIIPIEHKSGLAPANAWAPYQGHWSQGGGYGVLSSLFLRQNGIEGAYADTVVVDYMQDPQRAPRLIRAPIAGKAAQTFLSKAKSFVNLKWKWQENPKELLKAWDETYKKMYQQKYGGAKYGAMEKGVKLYADSI